VDLIVGASSAFYGPNAFNGVISMETKNPFLNQGVAASFKMGERNLYEGALRLAGALKNKNGHEWAAAKLNLFYLTADDWEADNYDPVTGSKDGLFYPAGQNPGRWDAVNIYGDEYNVLNDKSGASWWFKEAGMGVFYRTGYKEEELVDYDTRNTKANVALHFRTSPSKTFESPELILSSSYGSGTTVYQGDNRFSLRDIKFLQNRIEFRKRDKFFVRVYSTNEDAGNSYDPYATALKMQEYSKTTEEWATAYNNWWINLNLGNIYSGHMVPLGYPEVGDSAGVYDWMELYRDSLVVWHQQAEAYTNKKQAGSANTVKDFLEPGTPEFQHVFDSLTSLKSNGVEGGTKFYDKSALYHAHAEYTFTPTFLDKWVVGANGRMYKPVSEGTIFKDTGDVKITNKEFGVYTGVEKTFGKFKLNAAIRMDKNENFDYIYTPAASVVWNPKENTYLRFSFSSAIRNPTLADQYLYLDVGRATLIGNLEGFDSLITLESFNEYRKALSLSKLRYFNVDPIQPEKAKTLEAGLRTTLFDKVYVDAGYYYTFYDDFIGYNIGLVSKFDPIFPLPIPGTVNVYRVAANSINTVTTQGLALGLNYYFADYYMVSGNYSWNKLNKTFDDDPIIPAFNTPENKFNVGFSGRDLPLQKGRRTGPRWGFNVQYKWIQGFTFEGSPQFSGDIPDYDLLDAQINLLVPKINTTFKIGASNVLNNKQFQTYGGPRIGRMAYLHIVYDFRKSSAN
jgi:outer membrane receptor protein involved in Fe transport